MRNRTVFTIWAVAMLGVISGCSAQPSVEEPSAGRDTGTVNAQTDAGGGPEVVSGSVVE